MMGITVLTVAVFTMLAIVMLIRLYPQSQGFLYSLILISIPTTAITSYDVVAAAFPNWTVPIYLLSIFGQLIMFYFILIFPNGRLSPRWTFVLPFIFVFWSLSGEFGKSGGFTLPLSILLFSLLGTFFAVVVYRYRRVFSRTERQQAKIVVFGLLIFFLAFLVWSITFEFSNPAAGQEKLITNLVGWTLTLLAILALPVAIFSAILRYRLWDIDVIIRRTLVYGGSDRHPGAGLPGNCDLAPGSFFGGQRSAVGGRHGHLHPADRRPVQPRCAAASRSTSTGASTARNTTPSRPSSASPPPPARRPTWRRSAPSCWPWWPRRCSRRR